ncbi:MAG: hypothetical protein IJW46_04645 [Clostridia bacterium]|nr:hypothetical protein [Clostridia bacterium]
MKSAKTTKKTLSRKALILILCLTLILTLSTGAVIAYIIARTDAINNPFVPVFVKCDVMYTEENERVQDASVKNIGDIDAFIRAVIVVNWVSDSDTGLVHGTAPVLGTDYEITYGSTLWQEGSDGFWYYQNAVAPTASTELLFTSCQPLTEAPEGYVLSVEILANAVQSTPERAAEEAWGADVANGILTAP